MNQKQKKIAWDVALNLAASILPVPVLQFVILPLVGAQLSSVEYGLALTLISLMSLGSQTFGNMLNNLRLLTDEQYHASGVRGDFNLLLAICCLLNCAFVWSGAMLYAGSGRKGGILLAVAASTVLLVREYLVVGFRLVLNFKGIFTANIFLLVGYLVGVLLFLRTEYWQWVYLLGAAASLWYVVRQTKLLQEPFVVTHRMHSTAAKGAALLGATFFAALLTYVDRLLLYPLLGGEAVAIYYTASLFGKAISMAVTPVTGVLLSYLARQKSLAKATFSRMMLCALVVGLLGYAVCIGCSKPVLALLYPQWAQQANPYVWVVSLTAIVGMLCSVVHPVVLRFCNINWQIGLSALNLSVYALAGLTLLHFYGLLGFCFGALLASFFKLAALLAIYRAFSKKESVK